MGLAFTSYNDYTLNETYDSFTELRKLTNEIWDAYNDLEIKVAIVHPLTKFVHQTYKILPEELLTKTGLIISTCDNNNGNKGQYFPIEQYSIVCKYLREDKEISSLITQFPFGIIIVWDVEKSTIIHELQHAYDSFRSDGKFLRKTQKFTGEITSKKRLELYARTSHEMSAFFVAAINDLNFFYGRGEIDFKPFSVIYDEFKETYSGYDFLSDKEKKILSRKFAQYYFRIKERKPGDE